MKKFLYLAILFAAISCGTSKKASTIESLAGEWAVVTIDNQEIDAKDADAAPFLGFIPAEKLVYGSASCNSLTGELKSSEDGKIDLTHLGSTQMLCANMDLEQKMLDVLGRVNGFSVSGEDLQLLDESGKVVVELKKKQ